MRAGAVRIARTLVIFSGESLGPCPVAVGAAGASAPIARPPPNASPANAAPWLSCCTKFLRFMMSSLVGPGLGNGLLRRETQTHIVRRPLAGGIAQLRAEGGSHFLQIAGALGGRQRPGKTLGEGLEPAEDIAGQRRRARDERE